MCVYVCVCEIYFSTYQLFKNKLSAWTFILTWLIMYLHYPTISINLDFKSRIVVWVFCLFVLLLKVQDRYMPAIQQMRCSRNTLFVLM